MVGRGGRGHNFYARQWNREIVTGPLPQWNILRSTFVEALP